MLTLRELVRTEQGKLTGAHSGQAWCQARDCRAETQEAQGQRGNTS